MGYLGEQGVCRATITTMPKNEGGPVWFCSYFNGSANTKNGHG